MPGEGKTSCNNCGMLITQSCHAELVSASNRRSVGRILSNLIGGQTLNQVQGDKILKNLFTYSLTHLLTSKKAAFTLAEVLITLAIIGVVAAMTIPTLIADFEKFYQQLLSALSINPSKSLSIPSEQLPTESLLSAIAF